MEVVPAVLYALLVVAAIAAAIPIINHWYAITVTGAEIERELRTIANIFARDMTGSFRLDSDLHLVDIGYINVTVVCTKETDKAGVKSTSREFPIRALSTRGDVSDLANMPLAAYPLALCSENSTVYVRAGSSGLVFRVVRMSVTRERYGYGEDMDVVRITIYAPDIDAPKRKIDAAEIEIRTFYEGEHMHITRSVPSTVLVMDCVKVDSVTVSAEYKGQLTFLVNRLERRFGKGSYVIAIVKDAYAIR